MKTTLVPYTDNETSLEGFVAYPSSKKRPLVVLCHAWNGRSSFICEKAEAIAKLGYVGFALDMYGKGVLGTSKEENLALKTPFLKDRHLLQRRLLAGFHTALELPYVDKTQAATLGFGFGGLCSIDLARSSVPLKGAISIYGHFDPLPFPSKPITAKILILHGYNDLVVPISDLALFEQEMHTANVDWQAHVYGNTLHAFASPTANDPNGGLLYNPLSAERAWADTENFLKEIF